MSISCLKVFNFDKNSIGVKSGCREICLKIKYVMWEMILKIVRERQFICELMKAVFIYQTGEICMWGIFSSKCANGVCCD